MDESCAKIRSRDSRRLWNHRFLLLNPRPFAVRMGTQGADNKTQPFTPAQTGCGGNTPSKI